MCVKLNNKWNKPFNVEMQTFPYPLPPAPKEPLDEF